MDLISTKQNRPKQTLPNQTYLTKQTKFYQPNSPKPNQTKLKQSKLRSFIKSNQLDLVTATPQSTSFFENSYIFKTATIQSATSSWKEWSLIQIQALPFRFRIFSEVPNLTKPH